MGSVWVREFGELDDNADLEGSLPLDKAIQRLRDEITGLAMARHRGSSRELALLMTKLDEARGWAIMYEESFGSHVIVPKAEILREALTDTTDKTVASEVSNGV